jgi:thiosulfate/3-mercaptopyruvate sulfurtransferase
MHLAGRVSVEEWDAAAKATDTGFNKTAYCDDALGPLCVDHSAIAMAYDGGRMTNTARVWFISQYFCIKAVILNGGWPVLSSATRLPAGAAFRGRFPVDPRCKVRWLGRSGDPR